MIINDPEVAAELAALYPRYETALVTNDVDTLVAMFWDGGEVMRFGVAENLYGPEELEGVSQGAGCLGGAGSATVTRLDIVTFGRDFGSVTLEFERATAGGLVRGRQSQVWVRMAEGWRIVQAHVSLLPKA